VTALRVVDSPAPRRSDQALARPAPRRALRLWLPVTPLAALLSPLALVAVAVLQPILRRRGLSPWRIALSLGALLIALSGTLVEIETRAVRIRIAIF